MLIRLAAMSLLLASAYCAFGRSLQSVPVAEQPSGFATPPAAFENYRDAVATQDWQKLLRSSTPEQQRRLLLIAIAGLGEAINDHRGTSNDLKSQRAAKILKLHGLDEQQVIKEIVHSKIPYCGPLRLLIVDPPAAEPTEQEIQVEHDRLYDLLLPNGFDSGKLYEAISENAMRQEIGDLDKEEVQFFRERIDSIRGSTLTEVTYLGDRAQGVILGDEIYSPFGSPNHFRRINGRWYVEMPGL